MDILKINMFLTINMCKMWNSNHIELECKNPFNCINCTGEHPAYSWECEMWKKEKRITEIKYTRNFSFPKAQKIVEQTWEQHSYAYVTKKGNKEKEDTKPKQELNKLIKELKNLIEILKMITKETIKEHISTVPDEYDKQPKSGKKP